MDVFLLSVLCFVKLRSKGLADGSSIGVPPSVVRLRVISKPQRPGGEGPLGLLIGEGKFLNIFFHSITMALPFSIAYSSNYLPFFPIIRGLLRK